MAVTRLSKQTLTTMMWPDANGVLAVGGVTVTTPATAAQAEVVALYFPDDDPCNPGKAGDLLVYFQTMGFCAVGLYDPCKFAKEEDATLTEWWAEDQECITKEDYVSRMSSWLPDACYEPCVACTRDDAGETPSGDITITRGATCVMDAGLAWVMGSDGREDYTLPSAAGTVKIDALGVVKVVDGAKPEVTYDPSLDILDGTAPANAAAYEAICYPANSPGAEVTKVLNKFDICWY